MRSSLETITDFWHPHLDNQSSSGLTGKAYCLKHDLSYHRFCYHKRKQQSGCKKAQPKESGHLPPNPFIPVSVTAPGRSASGLTVTLPNGICISGLPDEHPEACAALIRALL